MIIYITLAYGLIVTAGAAAVYLLMRGEHARAETYAEQLRGMNSAFRSAQDRAAHYARYFADAQDQLYRIKRARHDSAKHARAAQIAQRKAQVLAKAAELQVDRIAA